MTDSARTVSVSSKGSKRSSVAPVAPKAPCTISPSATIANHVQLSGIYQINIASRAVLHPHARIVSAHGPVDINENCIIWEKVSIGPVAADGHTWLGDNVVVEAGATIEGARIEKGCIIESFAHICEEASLGKYCKIAPHVKIPPGTVLPDFTIVFGDGLSRKDTTSEHQSSILTMKQLAQQKQINGLQQLIPSNVAKWQ